MCPLGMNTAEKNNELWLKKYTQIKLQIWNETIIDKFYSKF